MNQGRTSPHAWRMVAIAFLAQNFAIGLTFGSYGTLVPRIESDFGAPRSLSTAGLALVILALSALAPVLGAAIGRFSLKRLMITGALLSAAGYLALAFADNIYLLLTLYALVIGPGALMLGPLPASTLITNWFEEGRGKALGIVNMPVLILLTPLTSAALVTSYGLRGVYLTIAALFLILVPLLFSIVDRPERASADHEVAHEELATAPAGYRSMGQLIRRPLLWLVCTAVGLTFAGSTMLTAHLVPMMAERQIDLQRASLLLAVLGGSGIAGAYIFGWLADRVGAGTTLAANAAFQGILCSMLLLPLSYPLLILLAVLLGASAAGMIAPLASILSTLFGPQNFGRTYGLNGLINAVFVFSSPPLAGYLFETTGSYRSAILVQVSALAVATFMLIAIALHVRPAQARRVADS